MPKPQRKPKPGRPVEPGQNKLSLSIRLTPGQLAKLDAMIGRQPVPPNKSAMIGWLIDHGERLLAKFEGKAGGCD